MWVHRSRSRAEGRTAQGRSILSTRGIPPLAASSAVGDVWGFLWVCCFWEAWSCCHLLTVDASIHGVGSENPQRSGCPDGLRALSDVGGQCASVERSLSLFFARWMGQAMRWACSSSMDPTRAWRVWRTGGVGHDPGSPESSHYPDWCVASMNSVPQRVTLCHLTVSAIWFMRANASSSLMVRPLWSVSTRLEMW